VSSKLQVLFTNSFQNITNYTFFKNDLIHGQNYFASTNNVFKYQVDTVLPLPL